MNNLKSKVSKDIIIPAVVICGLGYSNFYIYNEMTSKVDSLTQTINNHVQAVEQLKLKNRELIQQNTQYQQQLTDIQQQLPCNTEQVIDTYYLNDNTEYQSQYINLDGIIMEATCYSGSEYGNSYTADGTYCGNLPFEARFVASNDFALGSRLYITCDSYPSINGEYIVRDRMAYSGVIDIWFGCDAPYTEMAEFGRRLIKVTCLD